MSTPYTTPPWHYTKDRLPDGRTIHNINDPLSIPLATVDDRPRRAEANARLIAAAPSLLAACQALLDEDRLAAFGSACRWMPNENLTFLLEQHFPELIIAIAKATGSNLENEE